MKFYQFIILLRPYHWLKNLLIFVPIITAHKFQINLLVDGLVAFFLFSFVASAGYIINDIADKNFDSKHSFKKHRPIASGSIAVNQAKIFMSLLLVTSLVYAYKFDANFFISLLIYFVFTSSYSFYFKKIVLLDIIILAMLYSFRIVSGSIALEIPLSFWLIIFSLFFFLSLACIKRLSEIIAHKDSKDKKLDGRGYLIVDKDLITQISLISGFISALVILLYLRSDEIKVLYENVNYLYFISVIVIYWISRINLKALRGEVHFDPLLFAIQDKVSLGCLILMLGLASLAANPL
ncbi:UbiA family prenyltransferase [Gammaproteobacteria bacterium]|nr:UbiA family prenyltransferase [Gammaproteobacteria bacterium]